MKQYTGTKTVKAMPMTMGEAYKRKLLKNGVRPSECETADIIPNMQSLPQSAKDIIMARAEPHIAYTNQMLIVHPDGRADSWVPSSSDVFAEDWELVTE